MHEKNDDYQRSPADIIVYFGVFDLKQKNTTGTNISKIYINPDWSNLNESYDSDVALLKFSNPMTFNEVISPLCLWPSEDEYENAQKGTVITWTVMESEDDPGYWNHVIDPNHIYPTHYNMPIRSNTQCFLMQPRFKPISSERTFCAGGLNSGQCLEVGNSGASMSIKVDERFYLRGIVSASFIDIAGCDNITFTLFSDVLKHKTWIIDSMNV